MPKNRTQIAAPSIDDVREIADALCRAAHECYQQHGRTARIASTVDGETKGLERLCAVCDETLESLVAEYERAAADARPDAEDEEWWHAANALWLASREYARRHKICGAQTRRLAAHHTPSELETLHLEFELEASALLALKQSCEAYRRLRPQVL